MTNTLFLTLQFSNLLLLLSFSTSKHTPTVARAILSIFFRRTVNSKPPTIPFEIVACTFSDNLSRNSCIHCCRFWWQSLAVKGSVLLLISLSFFSGQPIYAELSPVTDFRLAHQPCCYYVSDCTNWVHQSIISSKTYNIPLSPNSEQYLISPHNIRVQSMKEGMRFKIMITQNPLFFLLASSLD